MHEAGRAARRRRRERDGRRSRGGGRSRRAARRTTGRHKSSGLCPRRWSERRIESEEGERRGADKGEPLQSKMKGQMVTGVALFEVL